MTSLLTILAFVTFWYLVRGHVPCSPGGYFPDPQDCGSFYLCDMNNTPHLFTCPENLHFNPGRSACDWPANCECSIVRSEHGGLENGGIKKADEDVLKHTDSTDRNEYVVMEKESAFIDESGTKGVPIFVENSDSTLVNITTDQTHFNQNDSSCGLCRGESERRKFFLKLYELIMDYLIHANSTNTKGAVSFEEHLGNNNDSNLDEASTLMGDATDCSSEDYMIGEVTTGLTSSDYSPEASSHLPSDTDGST